MKKFQKTTLSASSKLWLTRQYNDPYTKQAKAESYRSRAAYKLLQLQQRDRLIHEGDIVVDLGSAPGGWSQVAAALAEPKERTRPNATKKNNISAQQASEPDEAAALPRISPKPRVFAVDLLPVHALRGVHFIQGDFLSPQVKQQLQQQLITHYPHHAKGHGVSVVLSDMSPNISGVRLRDDACAVALVTAAFDFAKVWLKPGGRFACKMFQSEEANAFIEHIRPYFNTLHCRKPDASRDESREFFLVAVGFNPLGFSREVSD